MCVARNTALPYHYHTWHYIVLQNWGLQAFWNVANFTEVVTTFSKSYATRLRMSLASQQVILSSRSERATERMNKNATWTQTQTQIVIQRSIRRVHRIDIRMIVPTRVVGQTFNNLVLVNWTTPVQRTRRSNHVLSFLQRTQRAVRHQNRSTLYSVHF